MATPSLIPNTVARISNNKFNTIAPLLHSMHHFCLETGKTKKRRADNFLNIQKVLLVMVKEVELSTLSVGNFYKRHDGRVDFYNQGIDWICDKSGVRRKTVCRVLSALVEKGYMTVKHCAGVNTQGEKIRYNSIRTFTKKFFRECGARNSTIEESMNHKRKKMEKKFANMRLSDKCKQGMGKISEAFKHFASKDDKKQSPRKAPSIPGKDIPSGIMKKLLAKSKHIAESSLRAQSDVFKELRNQYLAQ